MGLNGLTIDKNNRVITSEMFPGRVQVFRYTTDAEFEAETKRREGEGETKAVATAEQKQTTQPVSSAAKDPAAKEPVK